MYKYLYNFICNFINCFKNKNENEEHTCNKKLLNDTNNFLYTENPIYHKYTKTKIKNKDKDKDIQ
jgi:hypothetical protein